MADPDIRLGVTSWRIQTFDWVKNLACSGVSQVYFFVEGGPRTIAKLDGGHGRILPLDPSLPTIKDGKYWSRTCADGPWRIGLDTSPRVALALM